MIRWALTLLVASALPACSACNSAHDFDASSEANEDVRPPPPALVEVGSFDFTSVLVHDIDDRGPDQICVLGSVREEPRALFPTVPPDHGFVACFDEEGLVAVGEIPCFSATFAGGPLGQVFVFVAEGECTPGAPNRLLRLDQDLVVTHEATLPSGTLNPLGLDASRDRVALAATTPETALFVFSAEDLAFERETRTTSPLERVRVGGMSVSDGGAYLSIEERPSGAFMPGGGIGVVRVDLDDGTVSVLAADLRDLPGQPLVRSPGGWVAYYGAPSARSVTLGEPAQWRVDEHGPFEIGSFYDDVVVREGEELTLHRFGGITSSLGWSYFPTSLARPGGRLAAADGGLIGVLSGVGGDAQLLLLRRP